MGEMGGGDKGRKEMEIGKILLPQTLGELLFHGYLF